MRQLAELLPLLLFFIAYQLDGAEVGFAGWRHTFDGIFSATAVLIAATAAQVLLTWLYTREPPGRLLWLLLAVCVFGGATLLFRDQTFLYWKPTVFNWGLALLFGGSQFIGGRNLMERILSNQLTLPPSAWSRLCWLWTGNFAVVGGLNLVVAYRFSESFWVSYKLYSAIGFTLLLVLLSGLVVAPHIIAQELRRQRELSLAKNEERPR